jgi:hypothetical protein
MKAEARALTFLANEGSVKIPFFQRAYVWNEANWEELISDLLESGKNHFLGSLILKQMTVTSGNTKQVLVIDGQQRLTTLSILLRVLYNSFDKGTQESCYSKLQDCLFYKNRTSSSELFVKIEHSRVDRKHFQSVIRDKITLKELPTEDSNSNVLECYKFLTKRVDKITMDKRIELFDNLTDHDNHILVVIDLTNDDDEQSIFDTINSAGMRLSCADIIKNVLFQRAFDINNNDKEVEALYNNNWEDVFASDEQTIAFWAVEHALGRLKRDNLEILLHSIAIIEGFFDPEKDTLTDLANIYKKRINQLNFDDLREFAGTISDYAKLYRQKMYVFDKSDLFEFDDYEKRLFHVLNVCDVSTFHPYILHLYKKYNKDESLLKSDFHKLETLVVRRYVCNLTTKNYNKLCKDFIRDSSRLDSMLVLDEMSDDNFKLALQNINNKSATLLLFWVELYRRKKDNRYDHDELKYTYTLEHIMPQKWEEFWSKVPVIDKDGKVITDPRQAKSYRNGIIYSIGNMTLLKSSLNTSLRNYDFKRKVEGEGRKSGIRAYAELGITKLDIMGPFESGNQTWDETKIRKRTEEITADALAIWS